MSNKAEHPERGAAETPDGTEPIGGARLKCDSIQHLLFAYMSHELGDVQSRAVREHLRQCGACREQASDIKTLLTAMQAASAAKMHAPLRLSADRRKRILRAVFHPIMDWIYCHHRLVSIGMAGTTIIVVFLLLRQAAIFREQQLEEGIPIWRMFRSGRLPELVEDVRRRHERHREDLPLDGGGE